MDTEGGCRSKRRLNVSSRSPPRDLWTEVTRGVYCVASVTLLWLQSLCLSLSLSLAGLLPLFSFSFSLSIKLSRSSLADSQVHANPPSYIQQTPSIYSFELDKVRKRGEKADSLRCRCVNFPPATPTAFLLNPASQSLFGLKALSIPSLISGLIVPSLLHSSLAIERLLGK